MLVMWWRLYRIRHRFESRHVVVVGVWAAIAFILIPTTRARSLILWEHTLIEGKVDASLKLRLLRLLAKRLYLKADRIVCVSDPLAGEIRQLTNHPRIEVIHNLLPEKGTHPLARKNADGPPRLLTVGSLSPTKNHEQAIRALVAIPSASLVVLGDGPERGKLWRLCQELSLEERVTFKGHVAGQTVITAMDEADLLVHPSKGETFGLVYFEAASRELPIVALDNPVASWCIPRFAPGITYQGGHEDLAAAVKEALATGWAPLFCAAAEARRHELDPQQVVERWKAILGWT